jgi:hypothetical protein
LDDQLSAHHASTHPLGTAGRVIQLGITRAQIDPLAATRGHHQTLLWLGQLLISQCHTPNAMAITRASLAAPTDAANNPHTLVSQTRTDRYAQHTPPAATTSANGQHQRSTPLPGSEWMCESHVLASTGGTVHTHQRRTVANYVRLRELAPKLPFIPVLQGDTAASYERCADLYERAGVDLAALPLVGVGSVCRRQHTVEVERIVRSLAARRYHLHAFGVKVLGLGRYADGLSSSDLAAWSFRGRHVPGCSPSHRTESNCLHFALAWHDRLRDSLDALAGGVAA